jgi:hypothetical protein
MSVRTSLPALAAAALVLSSAAVAQDSYSLKRVFKAGDVDKYRTVITMETDTPANPMTLEFTILTTETVKAVKPDGGAVVELKVDSANLTVKDQKNTATREMNDSTVITTTYDAAGKETKREAGGENGQPGPAAMILGLARTGMVPPRSLKLGEEWKYDIPPTDAKSAHRTGSVTILGLDKRAPSGPGAPEPVLKVRYSTEVSTPGPEGVDKVSLVSTALLDPSNGKALEVEGGGSGKLGLLNAKKITIKQQRLPLAAAK